MIKRKAYPRVSIAGNPSDGFWGRCLSVTFSNYSAECCISPSDFFVFQNNKLVLKEYAEILNVFSQRRLPPAIEKNKLALATVKSFFDFCRLNKIECNARPFKISYNSNIPYSLGFAGSTALSISILRALNDFYNTKVCGTDIESIALHSETHELKRYAGPQDAVAVNRESCVYMNFSKASYRKEAVNQNISVLEKAIVHVDYSSSESYLSNKPVINNGTTRYTVSPFIETVKTKKFPFFIITRDFGSDSSIELSPSIRAYRLKDKKVIKGMEKIASLADTARKAIIQADIRTLGEIINRNFELSVEYFDNDYLGIGNIEFVREAINEGAYAKFPGSGGAVFGLADENVFQKLKKKFKYCKVEKLKYQFKNGTRNS